MFSISRVLALVAALLVGPFWTTTEAMADQSGAVNGSVIDNIGAPIGGVQMLLEGPTAATTASDAQGHFAFTGVATGLYSISAVKGGYTSVTVTDIAVVSGATSNVTVVMVPQSLSSLRVLGRQIVRGQRGEFNTTPAAVSVVTPQVFADQGQLQVMRILDQTPGIVIGHPATSANTASPGSITFANIRGGLSFETASLIDGHPISVGRFGDYVTTFLNPAVLGNIEVVKGPGADAPEVNYAIGGTVNFITKNPTARRIGSVLFGFDNQGGQWSNWAASGSFLDNDRLGYVLDYGVEELPGPFNPITGDWTLPSGVTINGRDTSGFPTNPKFPLDPAVQNNPFAQTTTMIACCFTDRSLYVNKTELVKLRYKLSTSTVLTASYFGGQAWADQNGNFMSSINSQFTPTGAYSGTGQPFQTGQSYPVFQQIFAPEGEWETNNEPIFQIDLRSSIGNDTILARGYSASIYRSQYNALPSNVDYTTNYTLWGTIKTCPSSKPQFGPTGLPFPAPAFACGPVGGPYTVLPPNVGYNGVTLPVTIHGAFFRQPEADVLKGGSIEYDHPAGNNLYSIAFDTTKSRTATSQTVGGTTSIGVPAGSNQIFSTILLRGIFSLDPKLSLELSNYLNLYNSHYSADLGTTFNSYVYSHDDPRMGITWRPTTDISWRFSVGSSIAPPYLNLLSNATSCSGDPVNLGGLPKCSFSNSSKTYSQNLNSGTILPETAWGYDWGGDWRTQGGFGSFSWDAYYTTLQNQFLSAEFVSPQNGGTYNDGTHGTAPLIVFTNENLGHSRYYGVEGTYRFRPPVGFGYTLQGALLRGYPYDLPPCFYTSNPSNPNNCINPAFYNTNLAILPLINFQTNGPSGLPSGFNAISNQSVPYSQGFGEVNWRGAAGQFYSLGETYYGNNNSYNVPAFFVWHASVREPIGLQTTAQVSVDNLFGTNSTALESIGGGNRIPLANNRVGLTNGNHVGPGVIRLEVERRFGYTNTGL